MTEEYLDDFLNETAEEEEEDDFVDEDVPTGVKATVTPVGKSVAAANKMLAEGYVQEAIDSALYTLGQISLTQSIPVLLSCDGDEPEIPFERAGWLICATTWLTSSGQIAPFHVLGYRPTVSFGMSTTEFIRGIVTKEPSKMSITEQAVMACMLILYSNLYLDDVKLDFIWLLAENQIRALAIAEAVSNPTASSLVFSILDPIIFQEDVEPQYLIARRFDEEPGDE